MMSLDLREMKALSQIMATPETLIRMNAIINLDPVRVATLAGRNLDLIDIEKWGLFAEKLKLLRELAVE